MPVGSHGPKKSGQVWVRTRSRPSAGHYEGDSAPHVRRSGFLSRYEDGFVLLIDDLEQSRRQIAGGVFGRYRDALDMMLGDRRWRAAVFFLVNMLEAYYFADAKAVNAVLGTSLADYANDVESISHPKAELKKLCQRFDEVRHGEKIVAGLDLAHVMARPETCGGLRALFAWCSEIMGEPSGEQFKLAEGIYDILTGRQLRNLALGSGQ